MRILFLFMRILFVVDRDGCGLLADFVSRRALSSQDLDRVVYGNGFALSP